MPTLAATRTSASGVLAQRNPLLLFLFVGWLLFRLAQRTFLVLLFQEPPRTTLYAGWPRQNTMWRKRSLLNDSVRAWEAWATQA